MWENSLPRLVRVTSAMPLGYWPPSPQRRSTCPKNPLKPIMRGTPPIHRTVGWKDIINIKWLSCHHIFQRLMYLYSSVSQIMSWCLFYTHEVHPSSCNWNCSQVLLKTICRPPLSLVFRSHSRPKQSAESCTGSFLIG